MALIRTYNMESTEVVPEYADNATAIAVGLPEGARYRTGDFLKVVHIS
tara:strand:- start:618 stop:761 length:144 start_codon:yes stop_codon:yes gene_type:complete